MNAAILIPEDKTSALIECLISETKQRFPNAEALVQELEGLMAQDLDLAIAQLPAYIKKANLVGKSSREAFGYRLEPNWITPFLDVLGAMYPHLSVPARKNILRYCLNDLDRENYPTAQIYLKEMSGPQFVADIIIVRSLYFPGFTDDIKRAERFVCAEEIARAGKKVTGTFWFATAMMWQAAKISPSLREGYYSTYVEEVDQAVQLLGNLLGDEAVATTQKTPGLSEEDAFQHKLRHFDPAKHQAILSVMKEKKWISSLD
jgi:hypothetical protein